MVWSSRKVFLLWIFFGARVGANPLDRLEAFELRPLQLMVGDNQFVTFVGSLSD